MNLSSFTHEEIARLLQNDAKRYSDDLTVSLMCEAAKKVATTSDLLAALTRIAECNLPEEGGKLDKHDAAGFIRIARAAIAKAKGQGSDG